MKYSLDTNVCIRYINGRAPRLRAKLPTIPANDIIVCSIVRGELFYGSSKSQTAEISLAKQLRFLRPYASLPFDDRAAVKYGAIRTRLEKSGQPIGIHDMLIAAIALANDLIVVTHNLDEFSRIEGLRLEDWER
jgi:tRNA(fMet)-specific endonuclease VapC